MNRLVFALAGSLAVVPGLALAGIHGNGRKVTQPREVPAFNAIRSEGSLDVTVEVGPARSVAVTIDENLQPEVETVVEGDTLVIRLRDRASLWGDGKVTVTVPSLAAFALKGSGDVSIQGASGGDVALSIDGSGDLRWSGTAARLRADIDGSGDFELIGRADALRASTHGSGDVKARQLTALSADVVVEGSGNVQATIAGGTMKARSHGSGDVHWWGTASTVDIVAHGSGEIAHD